MAKLAQCIPLAVVLIICIAVLFLKSRKSQKLANDDCKSDATEETTDTEFDLYGEVKSFMAKQTNYVMNGA